MDASELNKTWEEWWKIDNELKDYIKNNSENTEELNNIKKRFIDYQNKFHYIFDKVKKKSLDNISEDKQKDAIQDMSENISEDKQKDAIQDISDNSPMTFSKALQRLYDSDYKKCVSSNNSNSVTSNIKVTGGNKKRKMTYKNKKKYPTTRRKK